METLVSHANNFVAGNSKFYPQVYSLCYHNLSWLKPKSVQNYTGMDSEEPFGDEMPNFDICGTVFKELFEGIDAKTETAASSENNGTTIDMVRSSCWQVSTKLMQVTHWGIFVSGNTRHKVFVPVKWITRNYQDWPLVRVSGDLGR